MFTASGSQRYLLALSFSVPAPAFLVLVTPAGLTQLLILLRQLLFLVCQARFFPFLSYVIPFPFIEASQRTHFQC